MVNVADQALCAQSINKIKIPHNRNLPTLLKKNRQQERRSGWLANHVPNDSVRLWGAPLWYNGQPPDRTIQSGIFNDAKPQERYRITMSSTTSLTPRYMKACYSPEPNSHRIQFVLYNNKNFFQIQL